MSFSCAHFVINIDENLSSLTVFDTI